VKTSVSAGWPWLSRRGRRLPMRRGSPGALPGSLRRPTAAPGGASSRRRRAARRSPEGGPSARLEFPRPAPGRGQARCRVVPASMAATPPLVVMNARSPKSQPRATWIPGSGRRIPGEVKRNPSRAVARKPPDISCVPAGAAPGPGLRSASAAWSCWPSTARAAARPRRAARSARQHRRELVPDGQDELQAGQGQPAEVLRAGQDRRPRPGPAWPARRRHLRPAGPGKTRRARPAAPRPAGRRQASLRYSPGGAGQQLAAAGLPGR